MICLIEALNYRCMRYVSQKLDRFHVLIGPNASGKSTFLDIIALLGAIVSEGPFKAIEKRAPSYQDLMWLKEERIIELAIEAEIPENIKQKVDRKGDINCRYEISLGKVIETGEFGILSETLWLKPRTINNERQLEVFPSPAPPPYSIVTKSIKRNWKKIINKVKGGNDNFYAETKGFDHAFKLGFQKSALGNLPEDEEKFPIATWFRRFLKEGIQVISLNSESMRKPSPPGLPISFLPDGSNLPWVIEGLLRKDKQKFEAWIEHIQTALPDLRTIRTFERPEDKHKYLYVCYNNGLEIPSWMVSDGTLRMLALTILAYIPGIEGIYLIEEPENGIHPRAIETVFQSLSSVYNAQVLLATHSPIILSIAKKEVILCFAKDNKGAVDVVTGSNHPSLRDWKGETTLDVLFASGVLG